MFKSTAHPTKGPILNAQATVDDWNLANNNTDRAICLLDNMKAIVNDTIKKVFETNNEEIPIPMLEDKKPEIKPIKKEKK